MLGEKNDLHNRSMLISGAFAQSEKLDIEDKKVDIRYLITSKVSKKTFEHIEKLYSRLGTDNVFGRQLVEEITGLKSSAASNLIKLMIDNQIIESVNGLGKGKYRFL